MLAKLTVKQLIKFCQTNNIQYYSNYTRSKGALVDYIQTWMMQEARHRNLGSNARKPSSGPVVTTPKVRCSYSNAPKSQYFSATSERHAVDVKVSSAAPSSPTKPRRLANTTHVLSYDSEPVRVSKPWDGTFAKMM